MRGQRQHMGWWLSVVLAVWFLPTSAAWGYFFDDRREMSLSGFAYTRGTIGLSRTTWQRGNRAYQAGNLVQHRNFLTLEWRHNIGRLARGFPTIGPLMEFLNFDSFDYYLNMRDRV